MNDNETTKPEKRVEASRRVETHVEYSFSKVLITIFGVIASLISAVIAGGLACTAGLKISDFHINAPNQSIYLELSLLLGLVVAIVVFVALVIFIKKNSSES